MYTLLDLYYEVSFKKTSDVCDIRDVFESLYRDDCRLQCTTSPG